MSTETKRRIEMIVFTAIALFGSIWCYGSHWCMCGHLAHGGFENWRPWVEDSFGLFAIITVAVIGLRNPFPWSRIIGIICGLQVALMFYDRTPLHAMNTLILFILLGVQLWLLVRPVVIKYMAQQVGADQPATVPQSKPSDISTPNPESKPRSQ
jgi:hypothetical protein